MRIRNGQGYVFFMAILVIIIVLFMGYYLALKPYALMYADFTNDTKYSGFVTERTCDIGGGIWEDSTCKALPDRASDLLSYQRKVWLALPILVVIGLIFWGITVATKRDPREYYFR